MKVSTCMRKSLYGAFNKVNGKCAVNCTIQINGRCYNETNFTWIIMFLRNYRGLCLTLA